MKRVLILAAVLVIAGTAVFADSHMKMYDFPEGEWKIMGSRLYQTDETAPRAKAWVRLPQTGPMVYEFTARYQGGGEDLHGGFGIHFFADKPSQGRAWGFGKSWLLWINYDANPAGKDIPRGLSAQVYKSLRGSYMELLSSIDLGAYEGYLMSAMGVDIPIKIIVDNRSGRVTIADPSGQTAGWYFYLPGGAGMKGNYAALRTNSLSASFTAPAVDF